MKYISVFLILFVVLIPLSIYAHGDEEHNKDTKVDTFTVVNGDTIAVNGKAVNKLTVKQEPAGKKEPEFVLNPQEEMFSHLHNKIVHFPVALTLVAFLFSLLNIKKQSHCTYQSIKILLGISLLAAIAAYFTGDFQLMAFVGDPKEWLGNTHRLAGIISAILILIWFVASLIERTKKRSWIIGSIAVVMILITGFLGGVLAH